MDKDGPGGLISANHRDLVSREISRKDGGNERFWRPFTLNLWFASFLLLLVLGVAIALEVGLHFRTYAQITGKSTLASSTIHYATPLIPVIIAMAIVGLWAGTDADIKRMQPFIELASDNAPASHTLFVNYVNSHYAKAFFKSLRNKHYIVALSSATLILGFAVQPLAASIFSMKDVWWRLPETSIRTFNTPGLDLTYTNLSVTPAISSQLSAKQQCGLLNVIGEVDNCTIAYNEPVIPEGTEWYNSVVNPSCLNTSDPRSDFDPVLILLVYVNSQGVAIELKTGQFTVHNFTNYMLPNNITDPDGFMKGRAFNGLIFGSGPSGQAVKEPISNGYSQTFTAALQTKAIRSPIGLEGQMKSDGMLGITEQLYVGFTSAWLGIAANMICKGTISINNGKRHLLIEVEY
ncbi:hypothetical protein M422DRAFT_253563 [Sphaerobolus stellatus SS14]|uniref:Unplaced genomic scaffold SPHSTscaffold_50, whole genome shotgun sequence n=1 Tax=Sphaerobolus stellatus (strain SS14) TaxID=990650 RepID=A0A0C9VXD5_SPHS4|nr:hypothetical protein M422DRAFT_253563 [Sphaerobolus stellatus SS14]